MYKDQKQFQPEALSSFLARLNRMDSHHVGYCGEQVEEIYSTLQEEFVESGNLNRWFTIMTDQSEIVGVLGFNVDEENRSAELWGPFIDAEGETWASIAEQLWTAGVAKLEGSVDRYYGFYNMENHSAARFMEAKGGKTTGEHIVLRAEEPAFRDHNFPSLQDMDPAYEEQFMELHETTFPNTYYNAKRILQQVNNHRRLFILTDQSQLVGYVYVEGNSEFKEGSIEYIAVSKNFRRKGFGRTLLGQALNYLFHEVELDEISLCVDYGNQSAIQLYHSAGFKTVHRLRAYVLS
ncbi:GNAT family N-acetyltransferase [Paenibacillus sp. DMB20]|uniref:GNAT family N-acetyltransferase n=1 Tax=Paenibacillus sp. DMB20 TaxID=1642570 RepID=UPI000628163B|nr:GNAT family N-acetyltransferase [Paenibacillus sp. DMB20]KKO55313.1 GCN5 family acetyltransferase [Paenibacillus sp. DMB20]